MEMVLVWVIFDFIASIKNAEGNKDSNFQGFGGQISKFLTLS